MNPTPTVLEGFLEATLDRAPVSLGTRRTGSPHEFYRYPARFSPRFAAAAIEHFSLPGDTVLDPFVGGGTTLVEGMRLGRATIGADLNPLATFVTRVKTSPLARSDSNAVEAWLTDLDANVRVNRPEPSFNEWNAEGYFKGLDSPDTWRVRKLVGLAITAIPTKPARAEMFCRCIVLRTAQWALDMRRSIPSVPEFREGLKANGVAMLRAMQDFATEIKGRSTPVVIDAGLPGLADKLLKTDHAVPSLVLTSPPYPGVYVNYHRWKLRGRHEISAPYWIADTRDGNGLAHYTMAARAEPTLDVYFGRLADAFRDLARIVGPETLVVQMVGFSQPETQLTRYLDAMCDAGFEEFEVAAVATAEDGRLWRAVPGRRWWTEAKTLKGSAPHTSREVVLFHQLARAGES
ncbi:MAG TPA: DNA methyltransferase [Acidimicrobiia bacterium]|nr:DNA methyltransferase [Acidimicrobiia bacterium]